MRVDEAPVADICLGIGHGPREPPQDHAHENDGTAPHVCLPRVVRFFAEHLGSKVWIAADDARSLGLRFARVVEDRRRSKVDKLHDIRGGHDAVVEFQIAVRKPDGVQVFNAIADLAEDAVNLRPTHLARHHNAEEVVRSIFHDL